MYALLLAFRYLRTRLIPLVAIAAVGLCVALVVVVVSICLLYTSPSPRDKTVSRMPSSA